MSVPAPSGTPTVGATDPLSDPGSQTLPIGFGPLSDATRFSAARSPQRQVATAVASARTEKPASIIDWFLSGFGSSAHVTPISAGLALLTIVLGLAAVGFFGTLIGAGFHARRGLQL
jgi:hypothetical protein